MKTSMQTKLDSVVENANDLLEEITKHYKNNHPGLINHDINRDRLKCIDAVLKGVALIQREEQFYALIDKGGRKQLE